MSKYTILAAFLDGYTVDIMDGDIKYTGRIKQMRKVDGGIYVTIRVTAPQVIGRRRIKVGSTKTIYIGKTIKECEGTPGFCQDCKHNH